MAYHSAAERVASQLRSEILHGDIAAGSRLSQQRLAERFSVSRIPVRDALQILAGEGLVNPASNGTAMVTGMSVAELQELYELREAVEPLATQLGVPNVGRADVLMMRRQFDVMEELADTHAWLAANAEFHAAVYRRANRPRMATLVDQLRRQTDRYLYVHLQDVAQTGHLSCEHRAILTAVENGDAALAARLTREHLATAHDLILTYLLEDEAEVAGTDPQGRVRAGPVPDNGPAGPVPDVEPLRKTPS